MDRQRLRPLSRLRCRPVQGILRALVRHPQSAAWRLLGDAGTAPAKHLAQLLPAPAPRCVRRLPHLRDSPMKIVIVTPAPPGSHKGNRVSALRWARLLRELGHRVSVRQEYQHKRCDLLIALHARRSADAVERFRPRHPDRPLILMLTGTDLYGDIHTDAAAQ